MLESEEQILEIKTKYEALNIPKAPSGLLLQQLMSVDSWFVDAGVGLIYLTQIVPKYNAILNVVFWDGKLSADRREAIKSVLAAGFEMFELPRIGTNVVRTNIPLWKTLEKVGFKREGVVRKGAIIDGEYVDTYLYGMLAEEMPLAVKMRV